MAPVGTTVRARRQAGWDELTQLREEVSFTKGRIIVRGQMVSRGKAKRADYILNPQWAVRPFRRRLERESLA